MGKKRQGAVRIACAGVIVLQRCRKRDGGTSDTLDPDHFPLGGITRVLQNSGVGNEQFIACSKTHRGLCVRERRLSCERFHCESAIHAGGPKRSVHGHGAPCEEPIAKLLGIAGRVDGGTAEDDLGKQGRGDGLLLCPDPERAVLIDEEVGDGETRREGRGERESAVSSYAAGSSIRSIEGDSGISGHEDSIVLIGNASLVPGSRVCPIPALDGTDRGLIAEIGDTVVRGLDLRVGSQGREGEQQEDQPHSRTQCDAGMDDVHVGHGENGCGSGEEHGTSAKA